MGFQDKSMGLGYDLRVNVRLTTTVYNNLIGG